MQRSPDVVMTIMFECFSDPFQALLLTQNKLKALKSSDYSGTFQDDLLLEIYAIYKEASDLKFKMWAIR
eukprot:5770219-Ditylum_brightwellii.AAC.1